MGLASLALAIGTLCGAVGCGPPGAHAPDGGAPNLAAPSSTDGGIVLDASARDLGPCPTLMAYVPLGDGGAVCVDRYEAATALPGDGGLQPHAYDHPVDATPVVAVVADGIKPQAYISEIEAQAACQRAGKRLCKLGEWRAACQGPNGLTYPYGNTYQKGACNEGRATNPVNDCFGAGSSVFTYNNMNSPCCDDLPSTVAPGGAFPACVSSYGIYDLHGNLHEWIDATTSGGNGQFNGGFFVDATLNGPGCLYRTTAHAKSYHDYSTGFRCCADPK